MAGKTLESCVRDAMKTVRNGSPISGKWQERAWEVPPDKSDTLLMNVYHDDGISFFGDLTIYTLGFMQALLRRDKNLPMLPVEQKPPPQGSEYIHSMMYWMVIRNHVLVLQSRSLTTKNLEQYLTWLLKEQTRQVPANTNITLDAKFDKAEVGGDLDDISEIVVGGTGVRSSHLESQLHTQVTEENVGVGSRRSWGERALQIIRAIMSNEADVKKLLQQIPEGADINVAVHIGYKTSQRKLSRAPMQHALRNLPEGEVTAIGKFGRMTGNDIRLSYNVSVLCDGNLLDMQDVRKKLKSAYHYFVENGKIEP
jgi:hypothetical protein